ncbi:hypothetical protein BV20DRAFT_228484 [Pilatotrama ljubarskyi]|nr:hypothetical protein BV20DRAFT_228484 [Pilatotrama ljubarskyi]
MADVYTRSRVHLPQRVKNARTPAWLEHEYQPRDCPPAPARRRHGAFPRAGRTRIQWRGRETHREPTYVSMNRGGLWGEVAGAWAILRDSRLPHMLEHSIGAGGLAFYFFCHRLDPGSGSSPRSGPGLDEGRISHLGRRRNLRTTKSMWACLH